jgi:hypothetical protein
MYRAVVSQQGRVTLEADANEAEEIRAGETRAELIDIIGPSGTPDDGFLISVPTPPLAPFDFAIAAGTLYLGGVRVESTDRATTYLDQHDLEWTDYPAGAPGATYPTTAIHELIYLDVSEREVTAVEDPALREVALGGPDTAARTRMLQRVQRVLVDADGCTSALDWAQKYYWDTTHAFDPATMQLASRMRLKAGFVPPTATDDPCQPTAQSGFLGAENQLIRVQIAAGGTTFLWGYDNASFLYRVTVDPAAPKQLRLGAKPVDVFHHPRVGQWVEVLRTTVVLDDDARIASPIGQAAKVTGFDPTDQTVTIETDLSAAILGETHQVFLRVWERRQPVAATDAIATELLTAEGKGTGVRVWAQGPAVEGDYWMIGVRPTVPDAIFPARLATFQSPDGPNRWVVPLAVIAWKDPKTATVSDCRRPFDNLVELTARESGCCELMLSPGDDLQRMIDEAIKLNAARSIPGLHIRFAAGQFKIDQSLRVDAPKGGQLTVSGCGLATRLVAPTQEVAVLLRGWDSATVLDLSVEAGVARPGKGKGQRPDVDPPAAGDEFRHLGGAITFLDCRSSVAERVVATCGVGDRRAASCLTVRHRDGSSGDVRVRGCELWPGPRQIGVLLVNAGRATVDDNQIRLNPNVTLPDNFYNAGLKRLMLDGVRLVATAADQPSAPLTMMPLRPLTVTAVPELEAVREERTLVRAPLREGLALHFATDTALAKHWASALAPLATQPATAPRLTAAPGTTAIRPTSKDRQAVARRIDAIFKQVFAPTSVGPLEPAALAVFVKALAKLRKRISAAAGQGIVVAGAVARDVRISGNTITDAMDGIHVGLSTRNLHPEDRRKGRPAPVLVDRVQIVGNTVSVRRPGTEYGAHAGIFVGSAAIATLRDNQITVQTGTGKRLAEGIRVWGELGPMLLVTGNACLQSDVGIRVHVLRRNENAKERLWRVVENLVFGPGSSVEISGDVTVVDNVVA